MRTERRSISTVGTLVFGDVHSGDVEAIFHLERTPQVDWHGYCETTLPWKFREAWDTGAEIEFRDLRGNSVALVGGNWNPVSGRAQIFTAGRVPL